MRIVDLLLEGQDNAISRHDLCAMTGLPDRALRRKIAAERQAGALIISSSDTHRGGYYKPGSAEEIRRFACEMESRSRRCAAAAMEARRALAD